MQLCYRHRFTDEEFQEFDKWVHALFKVHDGVPREVFAKQKVKFDPDNVNLQVDRWVDSVQRDGLDTPMSRSAKDLVGGAHKILRMVVVCHQPVKGSDYDLTGSVGHLTGPLYASASDVYPFSQFVYRFASPVITSRVLERRCLHERKTLSSVLPHIMSGGLTRAEKGLWYEAFVYSMLKCHTAASEWTLPGRWLSGRQGEAPWPVPVCGRELQFSHKLDLPEQREPTALCAPSSSAFPAIDFVWGPYLIQVTIATSHSFIVNSTNAEVIIHLSQIYGKELELIVVVPTHEVRSAFSKVNPTRTTALEAKGNARVTLALSKALKLRQRVVVLG
jgi:hypothetical protein